MMRRSIQIFVFAAGILVGLGAKDASTVTSEYILDRTFTGTITEIHYTEPFANPRNDLGTIAVLDPYGKQRLIFIINLDTVIVDYKGRKAYITHLRRKMQVKVDYTQQKGINRAKTIYVQTHPSNFWW